MCVSCVELRSSPVIVIIIIIIIITIIITHFTDGLGDVEADILVSVLTLLDPVSLAHLNTQITADENISLDCLKLFMFVIFT